MGDILRYAVFGNPIAHSRSPEIHRRFALECQMAMEYSRVLAPMDGFAQALNAFVAEGAHGCNVTLPFKTEAATLATSRSTRVLRSGAANTLSFHADGIHADNTDGIGLVRDLLRLGQPLAARHILVLGAGGAAAGILASLLEAGAAFVHVANRSVDKAADLARAHRDLGRCEVSPLDDIPRHPFDVVINATSAGLDSAQALVLPEYVWGSAQLAYDLVYGKDTSFQQQARAARVNTADGLGMLVEQAAEAFRIWTGRQPSTAAVLGELRREIA